MNAIDLLTKQHREVDSLFEQIQQASGGEQSALIEECAQALTVHAAIEEQIFYPGVKNSQTQALLKESVQEHQQVKQLLATLLESESDEDDDRGTIAELIADVQHHVKEEESALFPKVRSILTAQQLDEMGDEMETLASELASSDEDITERLDAEKERPAPI